MTPALMPDGRENVCRPKPNGNLPPAERPEIYIRGATAGKPTRQTPTAPAADLWRLEKPKANRLSEFSIWSETPGNGQPTNLNRIRTEKCRRTCRKASCAFCAAGALNLHRNTRRQLTGRAGSLAAQTHTTRRAFAV